MARVSELHYFLNSKKLLFRIFILFAERKFVIHIAHIQLKYVRKCLMPNKMLLLYTGNIMGDLLVRKKCMRYLNYNFQNVPP